MIRKNILAITLLGVLGLSHAADVENLRTLSYLNEPLRLQADVIGEGDIILAAPTEYLRLNHPIPGYDLSIDVVEQNGQKQVVLTTTEEIESPALTLLLESRDQDNRRQLFELPIILDFKAESITEAAVEAVDSEIVIDGVAIAPSVAPKAAEEKVVLADVPAVAKETATVKPKVAEQPVVAAAIKEEPVKAKAEVAPAPVAKDAAKAPIVQPTVNNAQSELVKRYPVEKGETLWSIANKVRPANVTPQKMIEIIKANNPSAFTANGVLRADVTLLIPTETPKVQHKFVAATDAADKADVRIGYIYELPEPPVQKAVEAVDTQASDVAAIDQNDEVIVKVVRPITNDAEVVTQEATVIVPANDQPVESVEATQAAIIAPQPLENASSVEVAPPEEVEPVKAVEPVQEEVVKPVEPPKKRPVYVMPEPEEPGIVELIFDNIVYVGAGALVLILGLLAVVMRRRKQGDEPKPPKEKKVKTKKAEIAPVEAAPVEEKPQVAPIAAVAAAAVVTEAVTENVVLAKTETKTETNDEPSIESLDFDLSFTEDAPSSNVVETEEKEEAGLDFDLSSLDLGTVSVETEEAQVEEVEGGLDFDLSSLDLSSEPAIDIAKEEEVEGGLDFDLSTLDLEVTTSEPTADDQTEDYGGLEFDLSSLDVEPAAPTQDVAQDEETVGGLEFDLSALSTEAENVSAVEEEPFDMGASLDFDLGDFKIEEEPVIESSEESTVTIDSFGENNPLFTPQAHLDNVPEVSAELDVGESEPVEYISFPDLLNNAEDTLVKDDIEAEKPVDFGSFSEDEEAGLANLMEASKKSEGAEPKLDLSFVADTDDDTESIAFLDSLDKEDEALLDDPINSSVKDNVAKSMEVAEAPEPISINVEMLDLPTAEPEVTLVEPIIEDIQIPEVTLMEPVIEDIQIPEVTLMEPMVEEVQAPEIVIPEIIMEPIVEPIAVVEAPVEITPVAETVTKVEVVDNSNDADFESEQVKLELAVAYMDFDKSLARPLLDEVMRDGSPKQIERAQALLAQID